MFLVKSGNWRVGGGEKGAERGEECGGGGGGATNEIEISMCLGYVHTYSMYINISLMLQRLLEST